jgi:molybdate transport system substrate-binding protein
MGHGKSEFACERYERNAPSGEPISSSPLRILSAGAMHPIIDELAGALERVARKPVTVEFANSVRVKSRTMAGEAVDVVITTAAAMEELARRGKIVVETSIPVARSAIGIAVRAGAPRPDVGSAAAFAHALREARSIAIADPATGSPSGNHLVAVLTRLGISAELQAKIRWVGGGVGGVVVVGDVVASGEAEIGLQQVAEILAVPGLDLVGELPRELQHVTVFSAAVAVTAADAASAGRVVAYLASPRAAAVITAKGMQPA